MYKRLLLNNKISATFKLKTVTFCFFVLSFQFFWTQTNVVNNPSNDTIVVLITAKNKELRGLFINENYNSISVEIANEVKVFQKDNLRSFRYITRSQIKSIKEFKNPNPIATKYCYLPSAYITDKGRINTNSHYLITSNSKIGIHDKIEISVGNITWTNIFSSITYSQKLKNSFTYGVSIVGNFNLINSANGVRDFNGLGFIPRVTYGDEFTNTTIGLIGYRLPILEGFIYGGYFASQKKIAEKFTIAGEILGLTFDGFDIGIVNNIILNFMRNNRENWSIGVTVVNIKAVNLALDNEFIVLPYLGIQRKF
jgi:hypothetical protein